MSSGYCERCNREIWANSEREDLCADCENELLREQCASLRARLEEAEHEIDRLRAVAEAAKRLRRMHVYDEKTNVHERINDIVHIDAEEELFAAVDALEERESDGWALLFLRTAFAAR